MATSCRSFPSVSNAASLMLTPPGVSNAGALASSDPRLNVAVGGEWPGAPDESTRFPATLLVDYVRAYRGAV
jgi:hypothetical protein